MALPIISVNTTISVDNRVDSDVHFNKKYFTHFEYENQNYFRCEICIKHSDIVRRFGYRGGRLQTIANASGTRFRTSTLSGRKHCETVYHKECVKAEKNILLEKSAVVFKPMDVLLTKTQDAAVSRAVKLLIQVSLFVNIIFILIIHCDMPIMVLGLCRC